MDNLPTFSDLTQNKQDQLVKKEKEIKESSTTLKVTLSSVKENKSDHDSNNMETKHTQDDSVKKFERQDRGSSSVFSWKCRFEFSAANGKHLERSHALQPIRGYFAATPLATISIR